MHASIALIALVAALQAAAKPAPIVPAPGITAAPAPIDAVHLQGRDVVSTIPLSSCTLFVECCQQVLTVPVIPASFTALLPSDLAPIPLPTLGPVVGIQCTPATSANITESSCSVGGSPMCCQENLLDFVAEGCQPVVNNPPPSITLPSLPLPTLPLPTSLPISLPSIPGLPTISVPGLPISIPLGGSPSSSSSGLLGLPLPSLPLPSLPLGGDPAPTSSSSGLLGLPLPSLPLGGSPTSSSSGLLGLPLPSIPLPIGGSPTSSSSGLLGLPLPSLPLGGSPTPTSSSLLGIPLPSLPLGGSPSPTSSSLLGLPIPSLPLGLASEVPVPLA
ncbi:hypothetical protein TRAPUB_8002 [Trametes pubescens]|uniref:Hydrophobin n=1 Tax=Trametes pubescens TaxID=154538 RepID=A0A1M2W6G5_TRAPU|nr:hypothetical protein TRAPUB_8002 [Trametes pubescens]